MASGPHPKTDTPAAQSSATAFVTRCNSCFYDYIRLAIRPERREEHWPLENLLIKWRRHADCGFNPSTRQPGVCSDTYVRWTQVHSPVSPGVCLAGKNAVFNRVCNSDQI